MPYQVNPKLFDVTEEIVNGLLSKVQEIIIQNVIVSGVQKITFTQQDGIVTANFEPVAKFSYQPSESELNIDLTDDKSSMVFTLKPKGEK